MKKILEGCAYVNSNGKFVELPDMIKDNGKVYLNYKIHGYVKECADVVGIMDGIKIIKENMKNKL